MFGTYLFQNHYKMQYSLQALLAPSPAGVWSVDGSLKQFNDALAQWAEPVDQVRSLIFDLWTLVEI